MLINQEIKQTIVQFSVFDVYQSNFNLFLFSNLLIKYAICLVLHKSGLSIKVRLCMKNICKNTYGLEHSLKNIGKKKTNFDINYSSHIPHFI